MAAAGFSGPIIVFGQNPYPGLEYNPDLAPSMFWGGVGILDPRLAFTFLPGEAQTAQDFFWAGADSITTLSIVPYTKAVAAISASANATTAALTLVSASSATTGVYITPGITRSDTGVYDTGVGGLGLVAIDAYASVTASIAAGGILTVTANSGMPLTPGMVLLTTSGTLTGLTTLQGANVQIVSQLTGGTGGQGLAGTYLLSNTSFTATSGTVTLALQTPQQCAVPFGSPYSIFAWNPQAFIGRAVGITAAASATATLATVTGYDVYGFPMVEQITVTAGSQTTGKKAWKYIRSVTLNAADATHAYSVDTLDVFGFPLRSDTFADIIVNSAASLTAVAGVTAATGYLPSDRTTPTATTGDVRGTYAFTSATNTNKLVIRQSPQAQNLGSNIGLFGLAQYTTF